MHIHVCTSAGPIIDCINDTVSEGDNIVLRCEASEPVIFIFRGRERACDNSLYTYNDTQQDGGSYWEVEGNASSCHFTVHKAEGSDGGIYECVGSHSELRNTTQVEVNKEFPIVIVLLSSLLALVVSVLVIVLSASVWKHYRKQKKRLLDPPGKISQSSTSLFSLTSTIKLAVYVNKDD